MRKILLSAIVLFCYLQLNFLSTKAQTVIKITSPAEGSTYQAKATIGLSAVASSPSANIKAVNFYSGNTILHTEKNSPYLWNWKNVPKGNYVITAKAIDNFGDTVISSPVNIRVVANNTLKVKVTSPVNGAVYIEGNSILLNAEASSTTGTIRSVDFYYGDRIINTGLTMPNQRRWYPPAGEHYITAVVTDEKGSKITSAPVYVKVEANKPPTINGSFTANGNAVKVDSTEYRLTEPITGQKSSIWYKRKIDLNFDFIINTQIYLGDNDFGADGMAFVLQRINDSVEADVTGGGSGIGYSGLSPSLAVEFDTYTSYDNNDPGDDHLAFMKNGDVQHYSVNNPGTVYLLNNIEDGQWHDATFSWKALNHTLTVSFLSNTYQYKEEIIKNIFGGSPYVYWGFTGSTGGAVNYHGVRILNTIFGAAPAVSLTSPADQSTYLAGEKVYLAATASDTDGIISKVEFYNGNALLATATDSPYTFNWEPVPPGEHTLTAKATDNSGLATTSGLIHISVSNILPTVSITSPADDQKFLSGSTVHLKAVAEDADGRISKVEFYDGATLIATEYTLPYTFDWITIKKGIHAITAKAYDNWDAYTTSAPIYIEVVPNQSPTVSIIAPGSGQTFIAPATLNLEAAAEDADGRIVQVSFYNGTTLLTNTEYKAPFTFQWKNVPAGTYIITAVAKDNWSAETNSAPVTVNVIPSPGEPLVSNKSSTGSNTKFNETTSLQLSPNPARNILYINSTGFQEDKRSVISVISVSGIIISTRQVPAIRQTMSLDISSLSSGVYMIKMVNGNKVVYKKFVKL